ncbi:MAG: hypothetical protein Q4D93_01250 [Porphyromonas sp.]|nr:hypothetical protein [Porphyromonas sp.]
MKKKILLGIFVLVLGGAWLNSARAQNVIEKGVGLVNLGLGVTSDGVPVSVSYDYGVNGNLWDANSALTVGVLGGTTFADNYFGLYVGPRVGLHYHFVPELDTYVSLMLGFNYHQINNNGQGETVSKFRPEWGSHFGMRYLFTPTVGAFAELGYGYSILNLGVTFRL